MHINQAFTTTTSVAEVIRRFTEFANKEGYVVKPGTVGFGISLQKGLLLGDDAWSHMIERMAGQSPALHQLLMKPDRRFTGMKHGLVLRIYREEPDMVQGEVIAHHKGAKQLDVFGVGPKWKEKLEALVNSFEQS